MTENLLKKKHNVDIVFCIDGTGSMKLFVDNVKYIVKSYFSEILKEMALIGYEINSLRVKSIIFRDYDSEKSDAMVESPFFYLPEQEFEHEQFYEALKAFGGGDARENGLESLYYAMKSDFRTGENDKQVIVLLSDNDALDLGERSNMESYPQNMVDQNGLNDMWNCDAKVENYKLSNDKKRLIIVAPNGTRYETLSKKWDKSLFIPVEMDNGLLDRPFGEILKNIISFAFSR